jgi:hypothetical protein
MSLRQRMSLIHLCLHLWTFGSVAELLAATLYQIWRKSRYDWQVQEYWINWEINTPNLGVAGMLLHMNGKFSMVILKSFCWSHLSYWAWSKGCHWYSYVCFLPFDLHLEIDSVSQLRRKLYDKRDDFKITVVNFPWTNEQIGEIGAQLMHIGIPTVCEKHAQQVCCQSEPWEFRGNKLQRILRKNQSVFVLWQLIFVKCLRSDCTKTCIIKDQIKI